MHQEGDGGQNSPQMAVSKKGLLKFMPLWAWIFAAVGVIGFLGCCCIGVFIVYIVLGEIRRPPVTYAPMTTDRLIDEWQQNPAAAASKYNTNGVQIIGRLHQINSNIHGQTYIEVRGNGDDWNRSAHVFVLSSRAKNGLTKCTIGSKIVVKARSDGTTQNRPWLIADEIDPVN